MKRLFGCFAIVGFVGLSLASCGSTEQSQPGCQTLAECKTDELCVDHQCVKITPDAGADADAGQACVGKQASPTAGQNCGCSADCDGPELCLDELGTGTPSGWCLRGCPDGTCPGNLVCLQSTPGAPGTESCFLHCAGSGDCPSGQICQTLESGGDLVCVPLCQSDSECPVTGKCDPYSGVCTSAPPNPSGKETGEACTDDNECKSSFCIAGISLFPDGYCTAFCSLERQGCPDGSFCMPAWSDVGDEGLCMKRCNDVSECRTGYGCVTTSDFPGITVCAPPK